MSICQVLEKMTCSSRWRSLLSQHSVFISVDVLSKNVLSSNVKLHISNYNLMKCCMDTALDTSLPSKKFNSNKLFLFFAIMLSNLISIVTFFLVYLYFANVAKCVPLEML